MYQNALRTSFLARNPVSAGATYRSKLVRLVPTCYIATAGVNMAGATEGAVNLRDIGDVSDVLKKGVLYRCSQVYSKQVLRHLNIKTVVDLRGRSGRRKGVHEKTKDKDHAAQTAATTSAPDGTPPAVLEPEFMDEVLDTNGLGGAFSDPFSDPGGDVVTIRRNTMTRDRASVESLSSIEDDIPTAEMDRSPAGPSESDPTVRNFNLIPSRQFGMSLLRFPRRVWVRGFKNLLTGGDFRKPFVDAFADEQVMGFTKYYIMMLEHSRHNIADVIRVFTDPVNLPALVHCAHGKDRTGVIIMLLLMVCEVPPEAITQDYIQSELELKKFREKLGLETSRYGQAVIPLDDIIIASTAQTIRQVMLHIESKYHTAADYLHTIGLTQEEIAAIKNNLKASQ